MDYQKKHKVADHKKDGNTKKAQEGFETVGRTPTSGTELQKDLVSKNRGSRDRSTDDHIDHDMGS